MKMRLDYRKLEIAAIIICIGIVTRLALAIALKDSDIGNIEPILPLALLAGFILGGWYALWVPLAMMVLSDMALASLGVGKTLGWDFIMGITFFTWSGMMLAGYVGKAVKPRMLLRMKNMAVFTGVGIVMVQIYDAWTMIGWWLVSGTSLDMVIAGQVTFTIYHILSTLVFVPLFGTGYIYLKEYGMPILSDWKSNAEAPEDKA